MRLCTPTPPPTPRREGWSVPRCTWRRPAGTEPLTWAAWLPPCKAGAEEGISQAPVFAAPPLRARSRTG